MRVPSCSACVLGKAADALDTRSASGLALDTKASLEGIKCTYYLGAIAEPRTGSIHRHQASLEVPRLTQLFCTESDGTTRHVFHLGVTIFVHLKGCTPSILVLVMNGVVHH